MKHSSKGILVSLVAVLILGGWLLQIGEGRAQQSAHQMAVMESQKILAKNPDDLNTLMVLGDAYLNLKKGPEAVAALEKAHRLDPDTLRAAPNLGLAYMMTGDYGRAISTWQVYAKKYPDSRMTSRLKKQTTVLLHLDAARWAKTSVRQEQILQSSALDENVVAVTPFGDRGLSEEARPLRKAVAAMTVTDLSKVKSIRVVERVKLQKLMDELRFGASGIVDEKTAPRLGRLLGAGRVITGSMASMGRDDMRVIRILRNVSTGADIGHQDAQGRLNEFFKIQKTLVFGILKNMGIALSREEEALVGKFATQSFQAVKLYGEALSAEDRGDWNEASRLYGLCAAADPASPLSEVVKYTPTGMEATTDAGRVKASIMAAAAMDAVPTQKMSVDVDAKGTASFGAAGDAPSPPATVATAQESTAMSPDSSTVTQNQTQGKVVGQETSTQTRPTTHYGFSPAQLKQVSGSTTTYYTLIVDDISSFDSSYSISTIPTMTIDDPTGSAPSLSQLQTPINPYAEISSGLPAPVTRVELGYNSYTEWGYWTQSSQMTCPECGDGYYFDVRNYYVWGDRTSDANMASLKAQNISGTYTGTAYGSFTQGPWGATANMSGTFSTNVNFGSGTLSSFNVDVSGGGHLAYISGASGTFSGGTSLFTIDKNSGTWMVDSNQVSVATNKSAMGSVYGPSGQEIGGQWMMKVPASNITVTGIFQGKK